MPRKTATARRRLSRRQEERLERRHSLNVETGVYFLRYVLSRSPGVPPIVNVAPAPADTMSVSLVSVPGSPDDCLAAPGDYMIVRAQRRAAITLIVRPSAPGGSLDAEVRLERLTAVSPHVAAPVVRVPPPVLRPVEDSSRPLRAAPDIQILAHVAHRGDILVKQGEWICGPDLPVAIEGLEIRWPNKPAGLQLTYSVRGAPEATQARERQVGEFAGTRGRASPLVGLQLFLRGDETARHEIHCDALFLGSQVISRRGSIVTLVGPRGVEPLVGLRLSVGTIDTERSVVSWATVPKVESETVNGRVHVYRSGLSGQTHTGRAHA